MDVWKENNLIDDHSFDVLQSWLSSRFPPTTYSEVDLAEPHPVPRWCMLARRIRFWEVTEVTG